MTRNSGQPVFFPQLQSHRAKNSVRIIQITVSNMELILPGNSVIEILGSFLFFFSFFTKLGIQPGKRKTSQQVKIIKVQVHVLHSFIPWPCGFHTSIALRRTFSIPKSTYFLPHSFERLYSTVLVILPKPFFGWLSGPAATCPVLPKSVSLSRALL